MRGDYLHFIVETERLQKRGCLEIYVYRGITLQVRCTPPGSRPKETIICEAQEISHGGRGHPTDGELLTTWSKIQKGKPSTLFCQEAVTLAIAVQMYRLEFLNFPAYPSHTNHHEVGDRARFACCDGSCTTPDALASSAPTIWTNNRVINPTTRPTRQCRVSFTLHDSNCTGVKYYKHDRPPQVCVFVSACVCFRRIDSVVCVHLVGAIRISVALHFP